MTTLTFKDVISEARAVPMFTGSDAFSLTAFLREAETLCELVTEPVSKAYVTRIILSKIQGEAAVAIRRLLDPTWIQIKSQLIKSFGVNESYLNLKEQADQMNCRNVSQLYNLLSALLDKLNLKYVLDSSKPLEFQPSNNEKSILEKFLNKINRVDSMFIRAKNIATLEEAHQALLGTGILISDRSSVRDVRDANRFQTRRNNFENNRRPFDTKNQNTNNFTNNNRNSNQIPNRNSGNFRYENNRNHNQNFNTGNNNYQRPSFNPNFNSNFNRNSGNFRNNYSGNFANRNPFNNRNNNIANPEPMDVDHNFMENSENFQLDHRTPNYP